MLRETTDDAARKNDAPYLCWQKVLRMLAGGNHTAKSKYPRTWNRPSRTRPSGAASSLPRKFPMFPSYKFQGLGEREKIIIHYTFLATFWAVYPNLQSVVVDGSLLLRPKTGAVGISLGAMHA